MESAHVFFFWAEGSLFIAFGAALVFKHWRDVLKEEGGPKEPKDKPPQRERRDDNSER